MRLRSWSRRLHAKRLSIHELYDKVLLLRQSPLSYKSDAVQSDFPPQSWMRKEIQIMLPPLPPLPPLPASKSGSSGLAARRHHRWAPYCCTADLPRCCGPDRTEVNRSPGTGKPQAS
ncbi:unnamed protein product, partial [Ectocarpus sp. 12 AP-2014]